MSDFSSPPILSKPTIQLWWFTALLITVNTALFGWQVIQGMDISSPSTADAVRWGADYAPLTFLAEPWRLFTSMFFHFGMIHLMLNMWALYIFGSVSEQLFGRFYFVGLYLLAGLMGSLLSGYVSIHDSIELIRNGVPDRSLMPAVGAGASGAVMGLGAALTVLSLLPVLPRQRFLLDKKTLVMVMGLNLMMGFMISGINNAAHIGGMLMGALLALIWYISQKRSSPVWTWAGLLLGATLCFAFYTYCMQQIQLVAPLWRELVQFMFIR